MTPSFPEAGQACADIVALAAQVCDVPIALIHFVDPCSHSFDAAVGLAGANAAGVRALCAHAAGASDELFVIEDAAADARFAAAPAVSGEPHIRFCAAAPIVMADGARAGAVCVLDTRPRTLSDAQAQALRALARQAAAQLELRAQTRLAESLTVERDRLTIEVERNRRQDNELLEIVLRGGDLGLWDLDLPSGQWTINAREREMLGYSADEAQPGKLDWKGLIHADDWPPLVKAFESHLRGHAPVCESVHRMRHREGHWVWVQNRSVVVERDAGGRPVRVVGTHMDVTAQKRLEDERRKSGERLALALSGGDIGLWDLDVISGKATYNAQWWTMFGYAPDEIDAVDGLWKSMVHPDDYGEARDALSLHKSGKTPMYEGEVRVRHKDGHWLWIQNRAKVVERDADGSPVRIVGVNLNITDRKENVLALERVGELLARTSALAKVGGWEIDPVTMGFTWSEEVYRIHDLDPGWEPTIEDAIRFYPPEARSIIAAAVEVSLREGKGWDVELPLITAKGRHVWVRALGETVFEAGKAVRVVGTIQDVTEHKHVRERLQTEQQRLRLITDNMPASVTHLDKDERYTFANQFEGQFFGVESSSLLGRTLAEVRGAAMYASLRPHVRKALQGIPVAFDNEGVTRGRRFFAQSSFVPDFDAAGEVRGFYAMTFDVTERKQAEVRRAESERRLRGLTDNVPALLTELDIDERVVFCNGRYQTWLGIPPAAVLNRQIRDIVGEAHYALRKPLLDRAFAGETVSFEQTAQLLGGERTLQTTYLPQKDAQGAVVGLYVVATDVSDLKQKERQLDVLAREDALTGLPNRRSFEERVQESMLRSLRSRTPICLMYLDIDHFKSINDSWGHAGGDAVLKEFGRRLKACVRSTDTPARYAGDEFVILLEGVAHEEDAQRIAEKILQAMRPAFSVAGGALQVTTSIGLVISTGDDGELSALLARADLALYVAKKEGRNRVKMAAPRREGLPGQPGPQATVQ